jgi:hypothetical protein
MTSEDFDPVAYNRAAWDRTVDQGDEWTRPVGPDVIAGPGPVTGKPRLRTPAATSPHGQR